jgi:hypothetical protein
MSFELAALEHRERRYRLRAHLVKQDLASGAIAIQKRSVVGVGVGVVMRVDAGLHLGTAQWRDVLRGNLAIRELGEQSGGGRRDIGDRFLDRRAVRS